MEKIDESIYRRICSVVKKDTGELKLKDYNGEDLAWPSDYKNFPRQMKMRYYANYYQNEDSRQYPTVWILVGYDKKNNVTYEQVGRAKHIVRALSEIRDDVKEICHSKITKYGLLGGKYKELVFYEVDIDEYVKKNGKAFCETFKEPDSDKDINLRLAYYFLKAAYVEGKIGFDSKANMYNTSSLDEYFYLYCRNEYEKKCNDCLIGE